MNDLPNLICSAPEPQPLCGVSGDGKGATPPAAQFVTRQSPREPGDPEAGRLHAALPDPGRSVRVKSLPEGERPRERLFALGPAALSDAELLAIILGTGTKGASALELGRHLVARFGGLAGLSQPAAAELSRVKGVGTSRAARVAAGLEIARRVSAAPIRRGSRLGGAKDIAARYGPMLGTLPVERIMAVLLDSRHRVISEAIVGEGTISESHLYPRDVLEAALHARARALILVHNHPSGDPTPSDADVAITERIALAAEALGVDLLDHVVVVAGGGFQSLQQMGLCPFSLGKKRPQGAGTVSYVAERDADGYGAGAAGGIAPRVALAPVPGPEGRWWSRGVGARAAAVTGGSAISAAAGGCSRAAER